MSQGIVVYLVPVAMDKGTNKEQKRRLGLVEISDQHLHYLIGLGGSYDKRRRRMERGELVASHPVEQSLQGLEAADLLLLAIRLLIRLPLVYVQLLFLDIGITHHLQAHIIKALQRAHASGSHGNSTTAMSQQALDSMTAHSNILGMHCVLANGLALHGLERTGTYM